MHYTNEKKRQFQKNWYLPVRDICAVNHMGLVLGLFLPLVSSKIDRPNEEFQLILSKLFDSGIYFVEMLRNRLSSDAVGC
ncbi:conserved domain protein [delta proteobacterium NaphS2]|nr:conserved domain protein [delta proteobacterium NaphS2]